MSSNQLNAKLMMLITNTGVNQNQNNNSNGNGNNMTYERKNNTTDIKVRDSSNSQRMDSYFNQMATPHQNESTNKSPQRQRNSASSNKMQNRTNQNSLQVIQYNHMRANSQNDMQNIRKNQISNISGIHNYSTKNPISLDSQAMNVQGKNDYQDDLKRILNNQINNNFIQPVSAGGSGGGGGGLQGNSSNKGVVKKSFQQVKIVKPNQNNNNNSLLQQYQLQAQQQFQSQNLQQQQQQQQNGSYHNNNNNNQNHSQSVNLVQYIEDNINSNVFNSGGQEKGYNINQGVKSNNITQSEIKPSTNNNLSYNNQDNSTVINSATNINDLKKSLSDIKLPKLSSQAKKTQKLGLQQQEQRSQSTQPIRESSTINQRGSSGRNNDSLNSQNYVSHTENSVLPNNSNNNNNDSNGQSQLLNKISNTYDVQQKMITDIENIDSSHHNHNNKGYSYQKFQQKQYQSQQQQQQQQQQNQQQLLLQQQQNQQNNNQLMSENGKRPTQTSIYKQIQQQKYNGISNRDNNINSNHSNILKQSFQISLPIKMQIEKQLQQQKIKSQQSTQVVVNNQENNKQDQIEQNRGITPQQQQLQNKINTNKLNLAVQSVDSNNFKNYLKKKNNITPEPMRMSVDSIYSMNNNHFNQAKLYPGNNNNNSEQSGDNNNYEGKNTLNQFRVRSQTPNNNVKGNNNSQISSIMTKKTTTPMQSSSINNNKNQSQNNDFNTALTNLYNMANQNIQEYIGSNQTQTKTSKQQSQNQINSTANSNNNSNQQSNQQANNLSQILSQQQTLSNQQQSQNNKQQNNSINLLNSTSNNNNNDNNNDTLLNNKSNQGQNTMNGLKTNNYEYNLSYNQIPDNQNFRHKTPIKLKLNNQNNLIKIQKVPFTEDETNNNHNNSNTKGQTYSNLNQNQIQNSNQKQQLQQQNKQQQQQNNSIQPSQSDRTNIDILQQSKSKLQKNNFIGEQVDNPPKSDQTNLRSQSANKSNKFQIQLTKSDQKNNNTLVTTHNFQSNQTTNQSQQQQQQFQQQQSQQNQYQPTLQQQYQQQQNQQQQQSQNQQQKQSNQKKTINGVGDKPVQQQIQKQLIKKYQHKTKAGCNLNGPKTNQDNFIITTNVNNKPDRYIFSVCDGHGVYGHLCSAFLRRVLPKKIEEALSREISNTDDDFIENSLNLAFLQTSKELLESNIDCTFSGSTCVLLLIIGHKMWSANAGDSRAIICSQSPSQNNANRLEWIAKGLSRDHKPDDPDEYRRIISRGGRVETYRDEYNNQLGPYRVWLRDENIPGLAMARSFGDVIASQVGVTCEPEVIPYEINGNDKYIILASDGVWEFISNEEVLNHTLPFFKNDDIESACAKLVKESVAQWKINDEVIDDITCIIVYLN